MGLRAHKLPLASVCVFSFALRIFNYWLIVIEQTPRILGVDTSVSALEMSDLPPVSVPAAGVNLLQRIQLITAIDKTPHDELQISTSMVINNLTPVSGVPFIGGNVNVCTKFIID